jgi:hypothetical protein
MPQEVLYAVIGGLLVALCVMWLRSDNSTIQAIRALTAKVDIFLEKQAACQTDNAKTYATKAENREAFQSVWAQVDKHGDDIAGLKAVVYKTPDK